MKEMRENVLECSALALERLTALRAKTPAGSAQEFALLLALGGHALHAAAKSRDAATISRAMAQFDLFLLCMAGSDDSEPGAPKNDDATEGAS